jgi:hypothetical protein
LRTPQPGTIVKYRQMRQAGRQGAVSGCGFLAGAPELCFVCHFVLPSGPRPRCVGESLLALVFCTFAPVHTLRTFCSIPPARRGGRLQDQTNPIQPKPSSTSPHPAPRLSLNSKPADAQTAVGDPADVVPFPSCRIRAMHEAR